MATDNAEEASSPTETEMFDSRPSTNLSLFVSTKLFRHHFSSSTSSNSENEDLRPLDLSTKNRHEALSTSKPLSTWATLDIGEPVDDDDPNAVQRGDIDPELNVVEVTEEAKAELAKIVNTIGDFVCQLCRNVFPDAFGLAQHRCNMIVLVEYRCPECGKLFNCPANLASHRRWHKPSNNQQISIQTGKSSSELSKRRGGKKRRAKSITEKDSKRRIRFQSVDDDVSAGSSDNEEKINELICQVCTQRCQTVDELIHHRSSVHSDTFPCQSCPDVFYSLAGLTRHINRFHTR